MHSPININFVVHATYIPTLNHLSTSFRHQGRFPSGKVVYRRRKGVEWGRWIQRWSGRLFGGINWLDDDWCIVYIRAEGGVLDDVFPFSSIPRNLLEFRVLAMGIEGEGNARDGDAQLVPLARLVLRVPAGSVNDHNFLTSEGIWMWQDWLKEKARAKASIVGAWMTQLRKRGYWLVGLDLNVTSADEV